VCIPGKRTTEAVAVQGIGVSETFDLIAEELKEKFRKMVG